MGTIYYSAWESIEKFVNADERCRIVGNGDVFVEKCKEMQQRIIDEYMKKTDKPINLDRHKRAAIIAVIGSNEGFIESAQEITEGQLFFGRYLIPFYAALAFMENDLNEDMQNFKNLPSNTEVGLCLPDPVICETKFANTVARMLYWEENAKVDNAIRVLELANTLFLIEQYTLIMYDVDIEQWTKYKRRED